MEEYDKQLTNPILTWGTGLVLGLLFGLIILGWWLFPVVWVDASPADLLYDYQVETLRTTIEAYGYNSDAAVGKIRYDSLGENREMALAEIVQNPGNLPPTLVTSFSEEVAGVPVTQLATQPIEVPETTTGLTTRDAIIGVIIFLLIGGLLTYFIFRGRKRSVAAAHAEEPVVVEETPVEETTAPVEAEAVEQAPEVESAPETSEEIIPDPTNLPPFLATASAAAAVYELTKDESTEEEVPVVAVIGEEMPEDVLLPEAELDEFPFDEIPIDETDQVVNAHDAVEVKMRKRLDYVEGIGPAYAEKLAEIGIETTGKLLVDGVSRKGRKDIAEKSGISERLILKWVNHVDLYRVKGIGSEYADLLESAGVDTIPELAQRRADNLHQALVAVNEEKALVRQLPTEEHVADWIEQAKELPRIIQY